jgi:tetratricopeptide (TPR) repeat protein
MTAHDLDRDAAQSALDKLFERARSLASMPETDVHIVELLSVYVTFEKHNGMAWFYFGDALRNIGRLAEGEDALSKAISLAPDTARFAVYARIGMLAAKRSSPTDAEKWYRLATAQAGCPGWMWCLRGANLLRIEAYALARTCLEAAMKSDDVVREEALLNLALIARAQRQYPEANSFIREALAIDPDYEDARAVLASLSDIEKSIDMAASVEAAASPVLKTPI